MPEVAAMEPFRDMQRIAVGMSLPRVEPAAIAQTVCFDHEGIAVPPADRISEPCRLGIGGQRTPVGEDLPEDHADLRLVEKHSLRRRLQDLELVDRVDPRHARRHAETERVIDVVAALALRLNAARPRRHLHVAGLQILREIEK